MTHTPGDSREEDPTADDRTAHRAGHAALVGVPNAGKSTLLNAILGEKIAIVSPKPQTTRDRIVGVHTDASAQIAFVDTPGLHQTRGTRLNQIMVSRAIGALDEVDVVVVVADAAKQARREGHHLTDAELHLVDLVRRSELPAVVALNKVDRTEKPLLLPCIGEWSRACPEAGAIVPISALRGDGVPALFEAVSGRLPPGPPLYPPDQLTDRPLRFIAAEYVREQLMVQLGAEVPYAAAVEVEIWEEDEHLARIHVAIHVEKPSQKKIVIGRRGDKIKAVGTAARHQLEALLHKRVFLETFVRVEEGWTDRERPLRRFGYELDRRQPRAPKAPPRGGRSTRRGPDAGGET